MHRVRRHATSPAVLALPAVLLILGVASPSFARSIHVVTTDVKSAVAFDAEVNGVRKATVVATPDGTVAYTFDAKSGDRIGFTQGTAVSVEPPTPLRKETLGPNSPNPFNPVTRIPFTLSARTRAVVRIYDVRGALVATLHDGELDPGAHVLDWNGRDNAGRPVASGIYVYALSAGGNTQSRKMTLLK